MQKVRYSCEVLVVGGEIRHSTPIGVSEVSPDQVSMINGLTDMMNPWLQDRIDAAASMGNATIVVKCSRAETSKGLSVEFKIQSVILHGTSPETTEQPSF
jgi:hypothetical protein